MTRGKINILIRNALSGASLLMLAACGGGSGGVNSASSNTSGSSSGSTTTTTTPVINYNDAEYTASNAASSANAISAWNAGATGTGQTIAFVDSGIDTSSSEFTGRISSLSTNVASSTGSIVDTDGHGTETASVAAAARNGTGVEGLAFNSTILEFRADTPGSCASKAGCGFTDSNIATAVNLAVTDGAKVINLSLGGSASSSVLNAAISKATAAGVIVVMAAGNDGTSNPDAFAQIASTTSAHGLVIIAGAVDSSGKIASFSDAAGNYAQYYLGALGSGVAAIDQNGQTTSVAGTSFAAPATAAAMALIEQAFPNLTPAQVVALLYSSATDAGTAGVDSVYGNGLLNLANAFKPQGTTSLAGTTIAVTSTTNQTVLSSTMGDAKVQGLQSMHAVVLDSLKRAYSVDVTGSVSRRNVTQPLVQGIGSSFQNMAQDFGAFSFSSTVARNYAGRPWDSLALGRNGFDQSIDARPIDGTAMIAIDGKTRAAFAFAAQGRTLADSLSGTASPGSFLAARASADTPGFATRTGMSFALVHLFGSTAITMAAERGTIPAASLTDNVTPAYAMMSVRAERHIGPLALALGTASLREDATVLGSRLAPVFGQSGSTTHYVDLDARLGVGRGWSLGAAWRQGWTRTDGGGVLDGSNIVSRSGSADVSWQGNGSRFALRVAVPPKVSGGGLDLVLPTSYDYATGAIGMTSTRIGLTPQGNERDVEASYGFHLAGGWVDSNLYWRRQPGNIAAMPDDFGTALRYSLTF
jgi:subtilisin family serine protease